jgi:hypothetical protein
MTSLRNYHKFLGTVREALDVYRDYLRNLSETIIFGGNSVDDVLELASGYNSKILSAQEDLIREKEDTSIVRSR